MTIRILTVFGTRPEAIKLAPVIHLLEAAPDIRHAVCVTGQHREMLDQILQIFDIRPTYDLDVMRPGQDIAYVTAAVLEGMGDVIDTFRPDWVIVQGDTTTAFSAALAAFYRRVKVAHVEAGLRTGDVHAPWPEEMNRRLVGQLASVHFCPTESAMANLRAEGIASEAMLMTGNTVIDALQWVIANPLRNGRQLGALKARFSFLDPGKRLVLATGHRRESFGVGLERGLEGLCTALREIAGRGDVDIVYPVHPNPNVGEVVRRRLGGCPAIHLVDPLDYLAFVYLMQRSYLIVTDSGGVQEEAPALARPVLVARDTTERAEALAAGVSRLVGTDAMRLVSALDELLDDPRAYASMARPANPFGDGKAAARIVARLTG